MTLKREKNLEAVLAIVVGLLVFYWFFENVYLLGVATALGIAGLFSPFLAKWIAWCWFKLAETLGKINGVVILTVLFFLFLTPLAWLSKLFKKDELQLKKKNDPGASYFTDRNHTFTKKDLENLW